MPATPSQYLPMIGPTGMLPAGQHHDDRGSLMHFLQRMAGGGRAACWVLCITLLAGCGGGPKGNEHVQYKGTALVVQGNAFEREATLDPPGTDLPERVVVQPDENNMDDALVLIERYGLPLEGRSQEGWLLVKVPAGFEMQWATALTAELGGRSTATTDSAQSPTPIVSTATEDGNNAVADEPMSDGEPVPDEEPSAADVRRLAIERYERLEDAGGLPATLSATGQSMVLHAKVFDARKQSCHQLPGAKPGEWECEAELMMGLCADDCDPSDEEPLPKGERVHIRWDSTEGRFTLDD